MSPDTESPKTDDRPFGSLAELRDAHSALMKVVGDSKRSPTVAKDVRAFLRRVAATGTSLGAGGSRETAQNILDFWSASLLTMPKGDRTSMAGLQLSPFDPSTQPPRADERNPYIGLGAFGEKNADQFYGREDALRILLEKIMRHRVVFVIGLVGGGKSSLVTAGALPRLAALNTREELGLTILPTIAPGPSPLAALLRTLHQAIPKDRAPDFAEWIDHQTKSLTRRPSKIGSIVKEAIGGGPLVLVVDSAEELFTLCEDATERAAFADCLGALAATRSPQHKIILIVREELAEDVLHLPSFKSFAGNPDSHFTPPPPTLDELRQIVTRPADAAGLKFDDGIVEDLAKSVVGEVTALPLLQFTLGQLWQKREEGRVTQEAYLSVGKPREALRRTTEGLYSALSPAEKETTKKIFLRLLLLSQYGGLAIRRRVQREALLQVDNHDRVTRVVDRFVAARLIRMTPGLNAEEDRFEIAHEALLTNWPLLEEWLREERHHSERKLQIIATARLYQQTHQPGYLIEGGALEEAAKYAGDVPEVATLVAASRTRSTRRRWRSISSAVIVAVVAVAVPWAVDPLYRKLIVPGLMESAVRTVKSDASSPASKQSELRWLARYGRRIDASYADLHDLDLQGLSTSDNLIPGAPEAIGADFRATSIRNVDFSMAKLVSASFESSGSKRTIIVRSNFNDANLTNANFKEAIIQNTTFVGAALPSAKFIGARFCGGVSVAESDLRDASFKGAFYARNSEGKLQIPDLNGTAWWLATGWTREQRDEIEKQAWNIDITKTRSFKTAIEWHETTVANARGDYNRASALNNKAWALALFGVGFEDGQKAAREALGLIETMPTLSAESKALVRANIQDTLGYLLMQDGKVPQALEVLKQATLNPQPEIAFRYAIALFDQGFRDDALRSLDAVIKARDRDGAWHEMHLLRRQIRDDLKTKLEKALEPTPAQANPQQHAPTEVQNPC